MLGLREQVERRQARVGAGGGDHEQVGRPGEAVDPDAAGDLALGLLHVEVAGPDDHVDGRDRLRAERQRGDRLRAAHAVDLVGAAAARRRRGSRDARRGDDDLLDAGRPGGGDAHDHRRRVRRRPPGA